MFGGQFPDWLRHVLDVPGYWLIILPVELPATFMAGDDRALLRRCAAPCRATKSSPSRSSPVSPAPVSSSHGFWSRRLGTNNDLGLRAILPAEVVLIVMTAAGMAGLKSGSLRAPIIAAALTGLALSVPDFIQTVRDNIVAPQPAAGRQSVRRRRPSCGRRRASMPPRLRASPTIPASSQTSHRGR